MADHAGETYAAEWCEGGREDLALFSVAEVSGLVNVLMAVFLTDMTEAAVDEIDTQLWRECRQRSEQTSISRGRDEGDVEVKQISALVAEESQLVIQEELESMELVKDNMAPGVEQLLWRYQSV